MSVILFSFLVDGVCDGISPGNVLIELFVGKCQGYSAIHDCWFNFHSYNHMIVSESYMKREVVPH